MADRFTFFASYYDSVENIESEKKAAFFDVIFRYALRDELPIDADPIVNALFLLVKPNIDKSKARQAAGRAGGKQTVSNQEANTEQTESNLRNGASDKDKDKDKDKGDNNTRFNAKSFRPDWFPEKDWLDVLTQKKKKRAAITERALSAFLEEIESARQIGYTVQECVDEMSNRSWAGFKAEWMPEKKAASSLKIGGHEF